VRNVLIAALGAFGITRQLQARREGDMVADRATVTAIGFKIAEAFEKPALGAAKTASTFPAI
jgi:hypothetical protein